MAELAMPAYRSHKIVHALMIDRIRIEDLVIFFADKRFPPRPASKDLFVRFMPAPGDYLVIYPDGYQSFSPKKAFEEGYTLIEREPGAPEPPTAG